MIHVYAFADELRELPDLGGLDGAPLEQLHVDGVASVFSRRRLSHPPSRDDAVVHGSVVDALERLADVVVPVRFGQTVPDEQALTEAIRTRAEVLRATFARVRGCAEVGVRVWGAPLRRAEATSGMDYLQALQDLEAVRREPVQHLHEQLLAASRAARVRHGAAAAEELFVAAYLVASQDVDVVADVVATFGAAHPDLTVACTGPWPPFSFAEEMAP